MAGRTYKRDGNGRFAGGGGGGGAAKGAGAKGAATKKANAARKAELVARGTSQLGRRVKAKGFEGGAAAQKRAGGLRTGGSLRGVYKDRGKAMGGAMKGRVKRDNGAAAKLAANRSAMPAKASKAAKPAKTSRAAPNKAKAAYKAATSQVRELKMYRGGKSDRVVKNAEAKVKRMETSRGAKKGAPKAVKTAAKVAAAVYAAGQTARAAMTSRRKR
jgi:hypothetical protein